MKVNLFSMMMPIIVPSNLQESCEDHCRVVEMNEKLYNEIKENFKVFKELQKELYDLVEEQLRDD